MEHRCRYCHGPGTDLGSGAERTGLMGHAGKLSPSRRIRPPHPPAVSGRCVRPLRPTAASATRPASRSERDVGVGTLQLGSFGDGLDQLAAGLAGLDDRVNDTEVEGTLQATGGGLVLGG
jgi:hypothetical protein